MRKTVVALVMLAMVVVVMAFGFAPACDAGTVGDQVFAAAGGDPSGGAIADALGQVDAGLDPVEAEAGDIPVC
jgi:hypothetical protein